MKFSEFELSDPVLAGVNDAGFTECTEVQVQTLTHTLAGRDVCVQSQTGTGKTAAYLISVFELMHDNADFQDRITMIIAPTRELAVQIEKEARLLGSHLSLRVGSFYGGVGYVEQEKLLAQGVDIVIGTPGRLLDFGESRKLDFRRVGIVIIDEADRLFDMGFYPDLRRMLKKMPSRENRISMLYSATLNVRARNIAWEHMHEPVEVEIHPEQVTVEAVSQRLIHVSRREKFRVLLGILRLENPESAIIFTNTKRAAEEVSQRLSINGYESTFIMGDLPQRKRLRIIDDIKAGKVRLLVATDVAARGLHIDDLDLVVNYDLPEDRESYVHRIGRTARAGKSGKAVSLADEQYVFGLEAIEDLLGEKIPAEHASDEMLEEDKSEGVKIHLGRKEPVRGRRGSGTGRSGAPRSAPGRAGGGGRRRGRGEGAPSGTNDVRQPRRESAGAAGGNRPPGRGSRRSDDRAAGDAPRRDSTREREPIPANHPGKNSSMEERIAYYERKYGEDFSRSDASSKRGDPSKSRKRSEQHGPSGGAKGSGRPRQPSGTHSAPQAGPRTGRAADGPKAPPADREPPRGEGKRAAAGVESAGNGQKKKQSLGEKIAGLFRRKQS